MNNEFKVNKKQILAILKKFKLGELDSIEKFKTGLINPAFLINGKYVLRLNKSEHLEEFPGQGIRFRKECFLYKVLNGFGIPTPNCIGIDTSKKILNKDYILISFIQGKTLKDAFGKSPRKVQENLAYQLGELARKIHSITSEKIGNHEDLLGNVYNWRDRYKQEFLKYFTTAKEKSYCPDKTFEKIEKIFLEFLEIKEIKSKLVHSDFSVSNIQIHEGKIVGIFDFEWAHWGDPLWDLQKLPINFQLGNKFSQSLFLKGYGIKHFNEEETLRLKMHAIHQGLWEIWATKNKIYPFSDKEIKEGENLIQIALTEKHFG